MNGQHFDIQKQWQDNGFINKCFDLADFRILPSLLSDLPLYLDEIEKNRQLGFRRVPYLITQSIIEAAHDKNILSCVENILGTDELVMWGPNLQLSTPNNGAAGVWHTDIESWYWPNLVTVVVGLEGCSGNNSTQYIPGSHKFPANPWEVVNDIGNDKLVLEKAKKYNPQSTHAFQFSDFGAGRFYVFDAGGWHRGIEPLSKNRKLLFLHYDKASNPRVPYMKDHHEHEWFEFAAPFMKINSSKAFDVNRALYSVGQKKVLDAAHKYEGKG